VKYLSRVAQIILDEVEIKSVVENRCENRLYCAGSFYKKASYEKQALEELKRQGAERIILDLRGNPEALKR
jgi:carboxyl-terminal processing protease